MGDRADVVVKNNEKQVCLYAHNNSMSQVIEFALDRGEDKWHNFQHLIRVVFCEMTENNQVMTVNFAEKTSKIKRKNRNYIARH